MHLAQPLVVRALAHHLVLVRQAVLAEGIRAHLGGGGEQGLGGGRRLQGTPKGEEGGGGRQQGMGKQGGPTPVNVEEARVRDLGLWAKVGGGTTVGEGLEGQTRAYQWRSERTACP